MTQHYESTETRRRQIADAALEVLAEEGLRKLTTRSIAARVGVTDGTLFRHFKNKGEIITAAMDRLELMMFGTFPGQDLDPMSRLERFFRTRATLLGSSKSLGRLVFSEQLLHASGEAGRARVKTWKRRNLEYVLGCLQELDAEGLLAEGLDAVALMPIIQGVLLTYAFDQGCLEEEITLQARIDRSWQTLHLLITR